MIPYKCGQWTRVAANDGPKDASDASEFRRQPFAEGHHWVPKGIYEKRDFSKETKGVFDNAKSGPLADPRVNGYTTEHREYNRAVNQLLDAFLKTNDITEQQMTPVQAEGLCAGN